MQVSRNDIYFDLSNDVICVFGGKKKKIIIIYRYDKYLLPADVRR